MTSARTEQIRSLNRGSGATRREYDHLLYPSHAIKWCACGFFPRIEASTCPSPFVILGQDGVKKSNISGVVLLANGFFFPDSKLICALCLRQY